MWSVLFQTFITYFLQNKLLDILKKVVVQTTLDPTDFDCMNKKHKYFQMFCMFQRQKKWIYVYNMKVSKCYKITTFIVIKCAHKFTHGHVKTFEIGSIFSWLLIFLRFHANSCHVPKSSEVYITLRMVSLDQHSKVWYERPCDLDLAGWLSESSYISSDPIGGIKYCPLLANDCPLASWACVMDMSLYL